MNQPKFHAKSLLESLRTVDFAQVLNKFFQLVAFQFLAANDTEKSRRRWNFLGLPFCPSRLREIVAFSGAHR